MKSQIHEQRHRKRNCDVFIVAPEARLPNAQFKKVLEQAKAFGGCYSWYTLRGAKSGFQFFDGTEARTFREWLEKQTWLTPEPETT